MVSKKNSHRGLVGCDVPVVPKARRSIRKKVSCKKTVDEPQLCPFELLATVAGKLLQEAETSGSASSSAATVGLDRLGSGKDHQFIKKEIEGQPLLIAEQDDQGSSEESVVSSGRHLVKKCSGNDADKVTVQNQSASIIDSSACTVKMGCSDLKSANEIDGRGSLKCDYHSEAKSVDNGITAVMGENAVGYDHDDIISATNKSRAKDGIDGLMRKRKRSIMKIDTNEDANNILFEKVALGRGSVIPDASFLTDRNDAKTGSSLYEDEILSQFFDQSNSKMKSQQKSQNSGGGRMTTGSKNWSSSPKLKDFEGTNSGSMVNNLDLSKKLCYSRERFELHDTPPKKRKLFNPSSVVTHDCGVSSESVSNSTRKGLSDNKSNPGIGVQSPSMERQRSFTSRNSPVKLSIKSFEVPELVIEVAESTTVGSLKKTILEAVARVFGEGLSVGLLHNGKRVYDDGKSLSEEDNLDNLGFLLEPNNNTTNLRSPTQPPPEDSPSFPISDNSVKENVVNRSQLTPKVEANLLETLEKRPVVSKSAVEGNNRELVPFVPPPSEKEEKCGSDSSRAVVPVVENVEALAVVGLVDQKPKRSEMGQRRTRRPFSVSEVEALVQAVEKLGTGRWRDVKLSAFENAKHRTYVDLKDKWKTLVHTARISPQQRRGEPVPQELLDRVLAAHGYWSQHQAKQHGKQQQQIHYHHQTPSLPIEKVAAA